MPDEPAVAPVAGAEPEAAAVQPRPIDAEAVRASFERLTALFTDMMVTVEELSTHRCPYRDRTDHCTAGFGCRNQRRPDEPGGLRVCGGDDKLDYRSAWDPS